MKRANLIKIKIPYIRFHAVCREGQPEWLAHGRSFHHGRMATFTVKLLLPLIAPVLFAAVAGAAQSGSHDGGYSYTDYSYADTCGAAYGVCPSGMDLTQAVHALAAYFARHGYKVEIREQIGHFLKADIYKGKAHVDTVILDMITGKLRSIY